MRSISDRQKNLYQQSLDLHGDSTLATHQNDAATQRLRFERLIRGVLPYLSGATLHDVGCGFGDLGQFLAEGDLGCTYSGIEIVEGMAEIGRKRLGVEIVVDDFIQRDYAKPFDFAVASGVFNIPGGVEIDEWALYCHGITKKMFSLARKGIAFNGLTTFSDFRREDLYYWSPAKALEFCQANLSRFCMLDHGYPLYEWTMTVFQPEFVRRTHPEGELEKYF